MNRFVLVLVRSLQLLGFIILPLWWLLLASTQWLGPYPAWLVAGLNVIPHQVFEPLILLFVAVAGIASWYYKRGKSSGPSRENVSILASTEVPSNSLTKLSIKQDGLFNLHQHGRQISSFMGRAEQLKTLLRELPQKSPSLKVIKGVNGIGKTQLALELGYHPTTKALFTDAIWFARASNTAILEEDLLQFANFLLLYQEIPHERYDAPARLDYLFSWLRANYQWLLILDDVQDPAILNRFKQGLKGSILITSDYPHWDRYLQPEDILPLAKLDPSQSKALLQKLTNTSIDPALAEEITGNYDHLPLFIELFADEYNHEQANFIKALRNTQAKDAPFSKFEALVSSPLYFYITGNVTSRFAFLNLPYAWATMTTIYIISLFDNRRIPISAFIEILKEQCFFLDNPPSNWLRRALFKLFNNNRLYYKGLHYQNKVFQRLLNRSIIVRNNDETISIDPSYQRALRHFLGLLLRRQPRLQAYGLDNFVDSLRLHFRSTKDDTQKEELLPHIISLTNHLRAINVHPPELLRLAKNTSTYLQTKLLYSSANYFSEYTYEQEREQLGKVTTSTLANYLENATQSYQTVALKKLQDDLQSSQGDESYILYQFALIVKHLQLFQMEQASHHLAQTINSLEAQADKNQYLPTLTILHAFALSSLDEEKCRIAIARNERIRESLQMEAESSYLFMEAATYGNLARITSQENEQQVQEYYDLAAERYDTLLNSTELEPHLPYLARIDRALLAFNQNDIEAIGEMAEYLERYENDFFRLFQENPLALGEYHLVQGIYHGVQESFTQARTSLLKALDVYDQVFDGHEYRKAFIADLLERIDELE